MACRECHIAKVKCDKVVPCARCVRLGKVCSRHESRQGQGRAKKRARSKISEDAALSTEVGTLNPNHYGLQYLIRSWVALAMRRRNFGLLARAGMIADRSGISMDQILCENHAENRRGMDYLYSILLTPAPQQLVLGNRLSWSEMPQGLLAATGCVGATDGLTDPLVAERWIWVREIRQGVSRYLVTPAFERDIAEWSLIQQTYQENKKSVVELFLAPSDIPKHTKALAHQISCHATPGLSLSSNRMRSKVKIKNKVRYGGVSSLDVDQVFCMDIQHIDLDFTFAEYVPHIPVNNNANAMNAGGKNNNNMAAAVASSNAAFAAAMGGNGVGNMAGMAGMGNNNNNNNNNNNIGLMAASLSNNSLSQGLAANRAHALARADAATSNNGVDADAAFKSGLDMGLPLLDLDNFDDDLDLDFFMNLLK